MNVIGIDYRRTVTALAVREGNHRPQPVGDGRRLLIPNAVLPDGTWGSDAAAQADAPAWEDRSSVDWFSVAARPFWSGLRRRLTAFLGGIDPVEHDYRVILALGDSDSQSAVAALAREAGFTQAILVPSPQAALAGWLAQQPPTDGQERTIAVATLGDVSVEAAAFLVAPQSMEPVGGATETTVLSGMGASCLVDRCLKELSALLPMTPPDLQGPVLRQLALEFGERLRRADEQTVLRWHGPLQENLVAPLQLSRRDVESWPESCTLADALAAALHEAVNSLRRPAPDVLLLTGLGACWPLPLSALSGWPAPLISENPALDVALGATFWPVVYRTRGASLSVGRDGNGPSSLLPPSELFDEEFSPSPAPPLPGGLTADEFTQLLDEIQENSPCSETSDE